MTGRQRSLDGLLDRLKEARERRNQGSYRPMVEYCLLCDEINLRTRDGEYATLDCRMDHHDYIITDGHDHGGIAEWIDCIEYLQEWFLHPDRDPDWYDRNPDWWRDDQ